MKKNCLVCKKAFQKLKFESKKSWEIRHKYCSKKCANKAKIGKAPWNKGTKGLMGAAWNKGKKLHYSVWNKGIKTGQIPWNKNKGEYAKKLGFGKWMKGKKLSFKTRIKISKAINQRVADKIHNFYIDGRTTLNHKIRHSLEYKLWREAVFKRDNYTCIWCNIRSGQGKKVYLNADHILPFADYPELRLAIDNGRTLCRNCHYKRHSKV